MASGGVSFAIIVIGLLVAGSVYVNISNDEETSTDTITYSGGSYSYTYSGSVSDYEKVTIGISIDDDTEVYDLAGMDFSTSGSSSGTDGEYTSTGSGNGSITVNSVCMDISITVADYSEFTFDFTINDAEDHTVDVTFLYVSDNQLIVYQNELSYTLAADGSSTEVTLLLTTTQFWAVFVAAIIFVLFAVFALIVYAAGGRR